MTGLEIPADGQSIWRVTTPAGIRYLRTRKGGTPALVPAGAEVVAAFVPDADEFAADAPAMLRDLWRLAEAQQPRWGWQLWQVRRLGAPAPEPDAWSFLIEAPDGAEQRYTWVRTGGGGQMRPLCAVEVIREAAARLQGP